jgi:hypothetical protein
MVMFHIGSVMFHIDTVVLNSVSGRLVSLISSKLEGLLTQESRPGRISAGRRGRIFDLDCSDWSNGLRHHNFDTRSDTEFKVISISILSSCHLVDRKTTSYLVTMVQIGLEFSQFAPRIRSETFSS